MQENGLCFTLMDVLSGWSGNLCFLHHPAPLSNPNPAVFIPALPATPAYTTPLPVGGES